MTIFDKLWYEMLDAKMREFYCTAYLKRHRNIKRLYKVATLVFSTSGILGWAFLKDSTFGIVTSSIISVISLLQLIEGQIFHSDDQLDSVCQLTLCYETHFRRIEQLFNQLNAWEIEDAQASKTYYQLCETYSKEIFDSSKKVTIKNHERMKAESESEAQSYLQRYNRA
ncbi:multidrug efflux pump subunit AcrB [Spirosoma lacussanchae]|uniref:hypothetical protein n=1 Tax=Spirosoma lacussanchae TaxID=1884249 RepID=UPI001108D15C|nr:hypothetical protein [Spirosoma lacussanchae]